MTEQRRIDLTVEVTGTPEEVWAAIATSEGVSAWLHPTAANAARDRGRRLHHRPARAGSRSAGPPAGRLASRG